MGIGIIDCEALLLDRIHKINGGSHEVRSAHLVCYNFDIAKACNGIAFKCAIIEIELVTKT